MTQPPAPTPDAPGNLPRSPAVSSRRPGCWGLGAISCGSLFLIFAVFFGVVFWVLRPYWPQIVQNTRQTALCAENLRAIHSALGRYRAVGGEYPARLEALHPEYLSRRQVFRCPADTSAGDAPSYGYHPPSSPASSTRRTASQKAQEPILTCDHHTLKVKGRTMINSLRLYPDGRLRQETRVLPEAPAAGQDPVESGAQAGRSAPGRATGAAEADGR